MMSGLGILVIFGEMGLVGTGFDEIVRGG